MKHMLTEDAKEGSWGQQIRFRPHSQSAECIDVYTSLAECNELSRQSRLVRSVRSPVTGLLLPELEIWNICICSSMIAMTAFVNVSILEMRPGFLIIVHAINPQYYMMSMGVPAVMS